MNKIMKQHLTTVVTAIVNEDSAAAKEAFKEYVSLKTQAILLGETDKEDVDKDLDDDEKDEKKDAKDTKKTKKDAFKDLDDVDDEEKDEKKAEKDTKKAKKDNA